MNKREIEKRFSLVKNGYFIIFATFLILLLNNITIASAQNADISSEKLLIIKGMYIGMDVYEAKKIMEQLLDVENAGPYSGWKVSPVGDSEKVRADFLAGVAQGEEEIFGGKGTRAGKNLVSAFDFPSLLTSNRGFAIQRKFDVIKGYNFYEGYISADAPINKVTRISLSGKLVDHIFSASEMGADEFVEQFRKRYNMPELTGIPFGWRYSSPNGYTVKITTNKLIDIKKDEFTDTEKNKSKSRFD